MRTSRFGAVMSTSGILAILLKMQ